MKIAIIDGQGGGIGKAIVSKLRDNFGKNIEIIALGTNSLATSNMLRNGADRGATGENSVVVMSQKVDVIIGPMAILMVNSMMGEITAAMAKAVAESNAKKIIIPLNMCNVHIVGANDMKIGETMELVIKKLKEWFND